MRYQSLTPQDYIQQLPPDRQIVIEKLRQIIKKHLPEGFEETISYDMISYVVPLKTFPAGYHCKEGQPLPFLSIASQKNFIAIYHLGLYMMPDLLDWFTKNYSLKVKTKLDMGKSCIRFKNINVIPYELIGELCEKVTPRMYIDTYEQALKR